MEWRVSADDVGAKYRTVHALARGVPFVETLVVTLQGQVESSRRRGDNSPPVIVQASGKRRLECFVAVLAASQRAHVLMHTPTRVFRGGPDINEAAGAMDDCVDGAHVTIVRLWALIVK